MPLLADASGSELSQRERHADWGHWTAIYCDQKNWETSIRWFNCCRLCMGVIMTT